MAQITLQGNPFNTVGNLPRVGDQAPEFILTGTDLSAVSLETYKGKKVVLNIFPSLDTEVCAASVRKFNVEAAKLENVAILCISNDLPFAHGRFCTSEGIDKVMNLSGFRTPEFGESYGVTIADGPLAGLMARSVVVLDEEGKVLYNELVPETVNEPDYDKALAALI